MKINKEDVFKFLDVLRDSGIVNMFGATPYIMEEFPLLDKIEARSFLIEWMQTYNDRNLKEV